MSHSCIERMSKKFEVILKVSRTLESGQNWAYVRYSLRVPESQSCLIFFFAAWKTYADLSVNWTELTLTYLNREHVVC